MRLLQEGHRKIALPRSVILIPPGNLQDIEAGGGAELAQVAFSRSIMDPQALGDTTEGLLRMLGAGQAPTAVPGTPCVVRLPPAEYDEAWALMRRLESEDAQRRPGRDVMQRLVLVELLLVVHRRWQVTRETGDAGPARFRIEDVMDYIRGRYVEELSLAGLATHFGFNPSYLSRLFARQAGVHIFEYVNRVRIQKSCLLLKRSSMSIVEIAFAVGYNNLSHFNRYFRRIMGMSPREYRLRGKK